MIKVHFFAWDDNELNVEQELGINISIEDFLTQNVQGLEFEATDNEADMDNNWIYWFSAKEETYVQMLIMDLLATRKDNMIRMNYTVTVEEW